MTRGEIKRRIRVLGQHFFGSNNDTDPFGLDLLITETANEIARNTDCYIGRRYLDFVVDTNEYCASDLYRVKNVLVLQSDGNYKKPRVIEWYDGEAPDYRRDSTDQYPTHVLVFGMNRIRLYPTPSVATTNGLMLEGYGIPGDVWVYDVNGNPSNTPADDQECPLPSVGHDAIVYGVLYKRAMQMRDADMVAYYRGEYEQRMGMLESFAATFARRAT